jgi:tetratricopeptide (TPR) repeat protein/O-antigen ligase
MLSAGMFFGSTLLSTLLSGSFTNSLWGEIPGQDGYSAYTIASYGILFGAIATHMKGRAQLVRLIGAIVLMGVLVGLYGTLQHYGHDFLGVTEGSGGGSARVTIFMGNTIFAAAVLSMTVPLTMVAAAINLHDDNWGDWGLFSRLGRSGLDSILTSLWALVLAVQLLGLMFTFSRGPWAGTVLALVAFLVLLVISSGCRMLVRAGLVIGLAGVLAVAFLHWQGSIAVIDAGPWFGIALALVGLAGAFAILFVIRNLGRTVVFMVVFGVAVTIVGTAVLAPSSLSDRGSADSTASQVIERIASTKTEVLGGFTGGRSEHWKISRDLILERPWFEFDHLNLPWIRPLIGYGPDMFRYTYLLRSPAGGLGPSVGGWNFFPHEPDHAHNFFIHQTVEQGIFGGLVALGLFGSVFGIAGHHLLRRRRSANPLYRLVLLGLTAIILGRFLEMMVGVARVSDLTVLWAVFGLFAASASLDYRNPEPSHLVSSPSPRRGDRRDRRRASGASTTPFFSSGLMVRLAIVAWLVGGIGVVTWQKGINPVRASIAEGQAIRSYQQGDMDGALRDLDKAIKLAPGVPSYYDNRAKLFSAYQLQPDAFTELSCEQQNENPYLECLALQSLNSYLESVDRQPFNFRARQAAGNSAYNLGLTDLAIESYSTATAMVPNAYNARNDLAEAQIDAGLYNDALTELEWSLEITGESGYSTRALFLKGKALKGLGRLDQASETLRHGLSISFGEASEQSSLRLPYDKSSLKLLSDIDTEKGIALAVESYDAKISQNPQDAVSYYLRGRANLTLGEPANAVADITESMNLGFNLTVVAASRVYAVFRAGGTANEAISAMTEFAAEEPLNAWIPTYLGEFHASMGRSALALNSLETANALDPELGLAYLVRAKVFAAMGLKGPANEALNLSTGQGLPTAQDYADRGEVYAYLDDQDLAFSNLDEAVRINPRSPRYYNARAKSYAYLGNYQSALADLGAAIQRDPSGVEYLVNRGVIYDILGDTERSLADFAAARSLDETVSPPPGIRDASYFTLYKGTQSDGLTSKLLLNLEGQRRALSDIEYYSAIPPGSPDYPMAFQLLGEANLELELWQAAADRFSQLLELYPNAP